MSSYLQMDVRDNVVVALRDLKKGTAVHLNGGGIILAQDIPAKHKFFATDLRSGDAVIMYGTLVGRAQQDIGRGEWMNVSNVKHAAESFAYKNYEYQWEPPDVSSFAERMFKGYHRDDGRVGTAN